MTSWRFALAGLLFALAGVGCMRQIVEELPSGPEASPAPTPVPISPIPVGGPTPTPTPTIIPAPPTPAPEETPTPPPASGGCHLPKGTGDGLSCPRTSPSFLSDVQASIFQLIEEQPKIFEKGTCQGCYGVLDTNAYVAGVVQRMGRRGYCAIWDGEELAVKNTNDFSDQYDILTSDNRIRYGSESYRATCRPAWF